MCADMSDEVFVDPDVFEQSKVHATIILKVVKKWEGKSSHQKKRGPNDKWQEVEEWEGTRYIMNFRNESGRCVLTGFRRAHYSKHYWKTEAK